MSAEPIRGVLIRDLRSLVREVEAYPDDELLWRVVPGIANAGGTLALHLTGNVQHYIGAVLGGTGYVRDRDAEFATRGLTRAEVVAGIQAAVDPVDDTLAGLTPERLAAAYPEAVGERRLWTADFLAHLVAHFGYHLGQIDYHRRILAPDTGTVPTIQVSELAAYPARGRKR